MSAYVVDKELIDRLVSGALHAKLFDREKATEMGQMLWRENVVSVAYRYSLATRNAQELAEYEGDVEAYEYTAPETCPDCGAGSDEIIRAIDCLDYQSCEHDAWETSAAYELLGKLRVAFPERARLRAVR
jgi:hypothetical protein